MSCIVGLGKELKVLTLGATVLPVEVEKEREKKMEWGKAKKNPVG